MSPITHGLTGWVMAHAARLSPRDQLLVTISTLAPDVDGLGLLVDLARFGTDGPRPWWEGGHHVVAHGLPFALLYAALAAWLANRRRLVGALAFVGVHLHLLQDFVGSGGPEGSIWPIHYLGPFFDRPVLLWHDQWALNAWPNIALTAVLLGVSLYFAWRTGRSPLSYVWSRGDSVLVTTLRERFGHPGQESGSGV